MGHRADLPPGEEAGAPRLAGDMRRHGEAVRGRGLSRHGEAIANVLSYRIKGDRHDTDVLVFLTSAGLVADTDLSTE